MSRTGRPKTRVRRFCEECGSELSKSTRGNLCRAHYMPDAEANARRAAAIKRTFQLKPHLLAERNKRVAEANRRPERRERAARLCRETRLWEAGLAAAHTPEARARQGQATSRQRLAHIPLERQADYCALRPKVGAREALRIITEHQSAVIERAHR